MDERLYINRLQKLYDLLVVVGLCVALPVTIYSDYIIKILLGPEFAMAAPVLTIYIWGSIAVFLAVASNQYLIAENYTTLSFYRTLIGVILNIFLNIIMIPHLGIIGSAIATVISQILVLFSIVLDKKTSHQFKMMIKAIFIVNILTRSLKKLFNL